MRISTNVLEEARENMFYLGLAEAELCLHTAPTLEAWLAAVVAGKGQQLRGKHKVMQFYCWHDAQASQLRFSLVSAGMALPFHCPLQLVELSVVVQGFIKQECLTFDQNLFESDMPAGQLMAEQAESTEFTLPVWRTIIP
ncbi:hypothetical protein [Hymenobacter ginsengisoli]|uniref:hypothetical protein n=1 Tax=Hymenobacter ginsengisoli TaxID=1051626 RepID=UPI0031F02411